MTIKGSPRVSRVLLSAALSVSILLTTGCEDTPDDPFQAAVAASADGDFQSASIYVRQALEKEPNNPAAIMLYGKIQLTLENPEGAAVQFKKLLEDPKLAGEANALLAKSYLQSGNTKLALLTLDNGKAKSGLSFAVSVVAQLSEGNADEAVTLLDEGLAQFPDSVDLLVLDAKRAYDQRDLRRSRELLAKVLKQEPNMIEASLLAGRLELSDRKLGAAKTHFAKVLNSNPWNLPAILSLSAISRDEGDTKAAGEWLARAREVSPGHPVGVYFAAQMAFEAGDVDQANTLVQSLGGKNAEFPALRMLRGMISARRGQAHTAISELERFFRLGGDNVSARIVLADQYAATGANQKAWNILQPVLASANANAASLQLGASLAGKLGDPQQAQLAERAQRAKTAPTYAGDLVKASALIRATKWDEADSIYQRALRSGGDSDPIVLNNAANIRLERGDTSGAVTLARQALQLAPNDPIIMDTLGWSLFKSDPNSTEAGQLITRALELAPGNKEISDHWIAVARPS